MSNGPVPSSDAMNQTRCFGGALPVGERERFDARLKFCGGSRRYLDQMRTTIRVVDTLTETDPDSGTTDQLLQLFRASNRT